MMQAVISLLSVVPMRKEPDHRSEMVSQLLFGECAEILEEQKDFVRIKCAYDGYMGWVQANQLTAIEEIYTTGCYTVEWCSEITVNGSQIKVPFGCPVHEENDLGMDYLNVTYVHTSDLILLENGLEKICNMYLDTPYLWGGRSVFGIDCSGFVQQVFKMFGVRLLRDAYLQAEQGEEVKNFSDAASGDLAFFQNEEGRITHVGIILSDHKIVHASGKVRIDQLNEEGIIHSETGKRTHWLHSVRRILSKTSSEQIQNRFVPI